MIPVENFENANDLLKCDKESIEEIFRPMVQVHIRKPGVEASAICEEEHMSTGFSSRALIHSLFMLACTESSELRHLGLVALRVLARDDEYRSIIIECGGVRMAIMSLQDAVAEHGAALLCNIATKDSARDQIRAEGGMRPVLDLLSSTTSDVTCATAAIRNIAARNLLNCAELAKMGAIPRLMRLANDSPIAIWALYNLCADEACEELILEQCKALAPLLHSPSQPLRDAVRSLFELLSRNRKSAKLLAKLTGERFEPKASVTSNSTSADV
mmetsp:Transcript_22792/g.37513  ORF Transcript_22792/g.37513 Transcript_22792/m.37513 type:complete len:272 (-) Transcript_22792:406-1221(-)|eukprot:CAMPEP_0184660240 /NCGR_PEP_ID=MMETSP0308-20130426/33014_1 /TAXON_ID=38269 /ORGANISM="Gloeochaete witrockiana, Strain SAG 46.84" /LENGTH=271 /DNA_ID=CAMNT_0027100663 /DNA_START=173 /DNA_END=988 /DNA_ORIENTATION=+